VWGNQINNNNNIILPCHVFVFAVGVDCVTDKNIKGSCMNNMKEEHHRPMLDQTIVKEFVK
jgi:hypothetical protein